MSKTMNFEMSASKHSHDGAILTMDDWQLDAIGGSGAREAAQGAVVAGSALGVVGASARLLALVPTPFSPALAAFGTATGLIGAGLTFAGGAILISGGANDIKEVNRNARPLG